MKIKKFLYRYPNYLEPVNPARLNGIAIHHTGNDNDIHINTDWHMDHNRWNWLGYGYYIHNGEILEVRGYKYKNAGVANHNHHLISIAVQGAYDRKIPSQENLDALQYLISYLKTKLPNISSVEGHSYYNKTTCPGRAFPLEQLKLEGLKEEEPKKETVSIEEFKKLEDKVKRLQGHFDKIRGYLDSQGVRLR